MTTSDPRLTREERERLEASARLSARIGSRAPKCSVCGQRMRKDDFNGMWCCRGDYGANRETHGGYQTQDQVARLLYTEDATEKGRLHDHQ